MLTKKQYVEYLLSTPLNYTCTNLANHMDGVSHDAVSDFLRRERFTPRQLWEIVKTHIRLQDNSPSYLICDDSVQDKRYSHFIDLVKRQYSGNEHGLVKGIGVVNLVHSSGKGGDFYPMDYRIYSPKTDGKSKNEHFQEMFIRAIADKNLKAQTILFDSWYASVDNLKLIHRSGWTFFTTLKSNRMVSISKEQGYIHLEEIQWADKTLKTGIMVKLKESGRPCDAFFGETVQDSVHKWTQLLILYTKTFGLTMFKKQTPLDGKSRSFTESTNS